MKIARLCGFVGGVPERSKGADCKSAGSAFEGSNPSPSTNKGTVNGDRERNPEAWPFGAARTATKELPSINRMRGGSSMVEQKPSKLMTRGRFPSPPPWDEILTPLQPM